MINQQKMISNFNNLFSKKPWDRIIVFSSLFQSNLGASDVYSLASVFEELSKSNIQFFFPAYTYSSRRNKCYFQSTSPPDPQCGALSRVLFEKRSYSGRTLDPDFSYLFLGPRYPNPVNKYARLYTRSFGVESSHENLLNRTTGIMMLGPVLESGLTPVMHLENIAKVPWRNEVINHHNCQSSCEYETNTYFTKSIGWQESLLPNRLKLKPIIDVLPQTSMLQIDNLNSVIFDWFEFSQVFFKKIKENIFFQVIQSES